MGKAMLEPGDDSDVQLAFQSQSMSSLVSISLCWAQKTNQLHLDLETSAPKSKMKRTWRHFQHMKRTNSADLSDFVLNERYLTAHYS